MRVWIDMTASAHVLVFRPLIERLRARGDEVEITSREYAQTQQLLALHGLQSVVIGRHGGRSGLGKARALAGRLYALPGWAKDRRFDVALAHGSHELTISARRLGVPSSTTFDYEWAALQHHANCRLATRVLVPDVIPLERLARYGARPPKLVRYPGLKEEYYLAAFEPDPSVLDELALDRDHVLCVVRTAPSYALYLGGSENPVLPRVLEWLAAAEDARTVVLARTPAQRDAVRALGIPRVGVPDRAVDGRSLVAHADVLVSAGGTMNREAAVLGTPVWSIFEGRTGAVDEALLAEGRLRLLRDPHELELVRKPQRASLRTRREPAELLRLAVPGSL